MSKVVFRLPSKRFQYGFVDYEKEYEGDLSPEVLGELYTEYVLAFQAAEIDKFELEKARAKQAEGLLKTELGATKISEEIHKEEESSPKGDAPWNNPTPQVSEKPWENEAPKVSLL